MPHNTKRRIIIGFFLLLYFAFGTLKIILTLNSSDFIDFNARNALQIENLIAARNNYSFVAVGNIRNSVNVFEQKLVPLINNSKADFVVLLGDAVLDGANDKYAALHRTLQKLNKPVLFTFGDSELSDYGAKNYFRHIGSPVFFFIAGQSEFLFLDTTGYTEENYQVSWLEDLLENIGNVQNRFVFMNRSPVSGEEKETGLENSYTMSSSYRQNLLDLFAKTGVSAVISSNSGGFNRETKDGVLYLSTGGGGGTFDFQDSENFFHCAEISVVSGTVSVSLLKPEQEKLPEELTFLGHVWNTIYSWVYVYFVNVLLIISVLFLVIYLVYTQLIERIDYYPDFNNPVKKDYPLTIAMFTNNYLPFIGGVPLSISRLKKGLEAKGHTVYVFAPNYDAGERVDADEGIIRCSPLFHYKKGDLIVPVSNIFSSKIRRKFREIDPDIVHVHHPFWLGSVGQHLAGRHKKPVVFTYHTRLEQYNHYVPLFHKLAGGQIPHMLIKYFSRFCDAVIAPTKSAKRYLRNLGIGKLIIVQPTGIELEKFRFPEKPHLPEDKVKLFTVFRLSKEKSPYFLLEGIKQLSKQCTVPFECLIAGTGPEEEEMQRYIEAHSIQQYAVLLGKVPPEDIPRYYADADLFVFSSRSETQGMVILEAMAGGTPVVAVDSSGISDIVSNGVNGYKTEADLNEWVEKVKYLLENEDERKRLSLGAVTTAGENSIEKMCENILDMYYEIIDWKKKHPYQTFIR